MNATRTRSALHASQVLSILEAYEAALAQVDGGNLLQGSERMASALQGLRPFQSGAECAFTAPLIEFVQSHAVFYSGLLEMTALAGVNDATAKATVAELRREHLESIDQLRAACRETLSG